MESQKSTTLSTSFVLAALVILGIYALITISAVTIVTTRDLNLMDWIGLALFCVGSLCICGWLIGILMPAARELAEIGGLLGGLFYLILGIIILFLF